jgi:hypothetical protein
MFDDDDDVGTLKPKGRKNHKPQIKWSPASGKEESLSWRQTIFFF